MSEPKKPDPPEKPDFFDKELHIGKATVKFYEDGDSLVQTDGKFTKRISYSSVVSVSSGLTLVWVNFSIAGISASAELGTPSLNNAKTLMNYIGERSGLELIGTAWRKRKSFTCPENTQPGCGSFAELLAHNDPDIADAFYDDLSTSRTKYVCFDSGGPYFFIIDFSHYSTVFPGVEDDLSKASFKDGQNSDEERWQLKWFEPSATASIILKEKGKAEKTVGEIDSASLTIQTSFENKIRTTTTSLLRIRFSTGKFIESFSFNDRKGEPVDFENSGQCMRLPTP